MPMRLKCGVHGGDAEEVAAVRKERARDHTHVSG